ncbi:MAG: NUDIX hydrolase [Candidatus Jorgensenbacteria bacterium GW2011_GWA2_45_13]|uniref:NUDIX hydrolase n=1 Tax=Candidatus Jorgensenbacteria bacterium GW2011_GWA2_45_13 TaxID=1618662 RepID=A0A0G1P476_9BACT|nr:MAG: NUDIX hydrolase [Candidatus Jorgensenbacteria bacterium GW2011_GWA2_45_13]
MATEISAGIIIYRFTKEGPKFLLLYHGGRYWSFPKGKLAEKERSFKAALREVWEETGIRSTNLRFADWFKVEDRFSFVRNKEKIYKTVTYYLAETNKIEVRIKIQPESHQGEHHEGYGWFLYNDGITLLKAPNLKRNLKKAYDLISRKSVHRDAKSA